MNRLEKAVVIIAIIVGLLGGVLLKWLNFPAIIVSVFLAIGVSVLVYHFMGGIKRASFKMGPLRLGGSLAALVGAAFVINYYLEKQMAKSTFYSKQELTIDSQFRIRNDKKEVLGNLPFEQWNIKLNKKEQVILNDSIAVGELSLKYKQDKAYYSDIEITAYSELYYKLKLNPVFKAELYFDSKDRNSRTYRNSYNDFPFRVEPVYYNSGDKTAIVVKANQKTTYHKLEHDTEIWITDFLKQTGEVYLVRVRQLNRMPKKKNFVQYQIIAFTCKTT
ncbi:hypothetical protein EMN47_19520 [Prolixibacteraceae bacterium JC049]|nr:hypothetical protein [Prolixibacteraceae bacterium JC049]